MLLRGAACITEGNSTLIKQARAIRTRDQILNAAAEEFALHGYAATNLAIVATRTGMTKGALYGHFASKRALADALVSESARTWASLDRSGAADEVSLKELVLAVRRQMKSDTRFRATVRLAADCTRTTGGAPEVLARIRHRITAAADRARQEAPQSSPLAVQSPHIVAHLLLTVVYGLTFVSEQGSDGRQQDAGDEVWQLVLGSLGLCGAEQEMSGRP
ncbi:TetR/AcrR family transcriptional regulator [Streptomyces sp. AC512_CC834]|uniref:TetR/AcrR family transcriptional regulator n=1 Tax=Streptomyces sp. AC512_CC834 TaxID=2823691 RepID=UPI0020B6C4A2|nr:TetR/AcrR family transcriptional regulator [Streptomyces sp. AC512_CC834]